MYELPKDERVIKVVRKYWLFLALQVVLVAILWVVPFAILWPLTQGFKIGTTDTTISQPLLIFGFSLWSLIVWFRLFYLWTEYYLDKWVITSKRIISFKQKGFFNREVSNFRIEKIQDTVTKVEGLIE